MASRRLPLVVLVVFGVVALVADVLLAIRLLNGEAPAALLVAGDRRMRLVGEGGERMLEGSVRTDAFDFPAVSPDGHKIAFVEFTNFQFYFDAYQHSFSPWLPDSLRLAYGANDGVYVLSIADGTSTHIGNGAIGLWVKN